MIALGLSVALFVFWLALGYAVVSLLHTRRNLLQSLLLAPSIGLAATVLPIFWLNRAGLPVAQFGVGLAVVLLLLGVALLWWTRPLVPIRRYLPFVGTFAVALGLTARPMAEFGFDWLSYANDDMANYVLGAHRFLEHGFFDVPDTDTLTRGVDYTLYFWLLYVPGAVRAGSELLLAWIIGVTGLTGHQVFMSTMVALHLTLISSAGALVCQSRRFRLAALMTCLLVSLSALTTLGTLYQLIAQVSGLSLLATTATLLLRPYSPGPRRSGVRRALLLGIVGSAQLVVYPEVVPFLALAFAMYLGVGLLRQRSTLAPRALVGVLGTAAVVALVLLNRYTLEAADFLIDQAFGGTRGVDPGQSLFSYYLVPSGLANLWGLQPISRMAPDPWLSASIVLGAILFFVTVGGSALLVWRRQPVAAVALAMFGLAIQLFSQRADFGLFKLAMFLQPFMLGALVVFWFEVVRRTVYRVAPLLLIGLLGLYGQTAYVEASRGFGVAFIEIRQVSSASVNNEFQQILENRPSSHIVLDTANIVLAKFQALYTQGISTTFASRFYFAIGPEPYRFADEQLAIDRATISRSLAERQVAGSFPWFVEGEPVPDVPAQRRVRRRQNTVVDPRITVDPRDFFINTIGQASIESTECGLLIASTSQQSIFNRRRPLADGRGTFFAQPCEEVANHLIFIDTVIGQQYYQGQAGWVSFYQLENDAMLPNATMAGVGRRMLLQVVNPPERVRLALNLTATTKGDGDNRLPPARAIGADRQMFPMVGRGSARVFSPPLEPLEHANRHFVGIDMGVEGQQFPDQRSGLMRLYGADVSLDRRRLVGFARDISVISEDDYARLAPPSSLSQFPTGLEHPDLEYSGVYEDGWISESAFFGLARPADAGWLAVHGMVPTIGDANFSSELRVLLDGQEVARRSLQPGDFDVEAPAPMRPAAGTNRQRVELQFSRVQQLPGQDGRPVAGQLRSIGFQEQSTADAEPRPGTDVVTAVSSIRLGSGWESAELHGDEPFRWVGNDAEIVIAGRTGKYRELSVELEPGPGVGAKPFTLQVLDRGGGAVGTAEVGRRERVKLRLPMRDEDPRVFRLHVDGGGLPTPNDPRILNFRVFKIEWSDLLVDPAGLAKLNAGQDIGPASHRQALSEGELPTDGLFIAEGWHPLETYNRETFRWVENDADVVVTAPSGLRQRVRFEVEPGPGVGLQPFLLQVLDEQGRTVTTTTVQGRQNVEVQLPVSAGQTAVFTLHITGGGLPTPNDPRALNFRVFGFDWTDA